MTISGTCVLQVDLFTVDTNQDGSGPHTPHRLTPDADPSTIIEVLSHPSSDAIAQSFIGIRANAPTVTIDASAEEQTISVAITN
ncbi:hypothetical protein [Aldersonia kunmingensis]|uniref:hypothetical protein n=1 Tax=Aldersonia kunmingensis TaxID=408066 RepID=UPI00082EA8E3|nr:hypothetical protein [Aldersonia kunmingensis]